MATFQAFYSGYLMIEADSEEDAAAAVDAATDYIIDESRLDEYDGDYQIDEIRFHSPDGKSKSII